MSSINAGDSPYDEDTHEHMTSYMALGIITLQRQLIVEPEPVKIRCDEIGRDHGGGATIAGNGV